MSKSYVYVVDVLHSDTSRIEVDDPSLIPIVDDSNIRQAIEDTRMIDIAGDDSLEKSHERTLIAMITYNDDSQPTFLYSNNTNHLKLALDYFALVRAQVEQKASIDELLNTREVQLLRQIDIIPNDITQMYTPSNINTKRQGRDAYRKVEAMVGKYLSNRVEAVYGKNREFYFGEHVTPSPFAKQYLNIDKIVMMGVAFRTQESLALYASITDANRRGYRYSFTTGHQPIFNLYEIHPIHNKAMPFKVTRATFEKLTSNGIFFSFAKANEQIRSYDIFEYDQAVKKLR
jgi:hypothetical protein